MPQTHAELTLCNSISLIRRFAIQLYSFRSILIHPNAVLITPAEVVLRFCIPPVCGFAIPFYRL